MNGLDPSMKLRVKGDTFFLPDQNGGVYFRNNIGSFRIEGKTIDQWVEKLIPVFNGIHTLAELTDGLPELYQHHIYEIAAMLYGNGFVDDVSKERPHQLPDEIYRTYASQIEFINSFTDSGAYRFQNYRQTQVLAVGSGSVLESLVSALFESGLPKLHVVLTDPATTNLKRLQDVVEYAQTVDPDAALKVLTQPVQEMSCWKHTVRPFDAVLYVCEQQDLDTLRMLHVVCQEEKKLYLPAVCMEQVGIAGPVVVPNSEWNWESAWRRLHLCSICRDSHRQTIAGPAGAILANVLVFELFKTITKVNKSETHALYLLDSATLEGKWHSFLPHPLVTGLHPVDPITNLDQLFQLTSCENDRTRSSLLPYFDELTSKETGIFHSWEEGELQQLPLALCRIEVANPKSTGPAELLPAIVCSGMTHEEARREAGLTGIEAYVSSLLNSNENNQSANLGVGAGQTHVEAVFRGLQMCLLNEFQTHLEFHSSIVPVQIEHVEDARCRFYLQSLSTMIGELQLGIGEEIAGFPTFWVRTNSGWYGAVGLNLTLALRYVLQDALQNAQYQAGNLKSLANQVGCINLEQKEKQHIIIPANEDVDTTNVLRASMTRLKQNGRDLFVQDLTFESFLKDKVSVLGVILREEEPK